MQQTTAQQTVTPGLYGSTNHFFEMFLKAVLGIFFIFSLLFEDSNRFYCKRNVCRAKICPIIMSNHLNDYDDFVYDDKASNTKKLPFVLCMPNCVHVFLAFSKMRLFKVCLCSCLGHVWKSNVIAIVMLRVIEQFLLLNLIHGVNLQLKWIFTS